MLPETLLLRTGDGAFGSMDCADTEPTTRRKIANNFAENLGIIRRKAYQIWVILVA